MATAMYDEGMTKTQTTNRFDLYQAVTDQIVAALEAGTIPWHKPWATNGLPMSLSTRKPYRGVNVLLLSMQADAAGYSSPWWGTYEQIGQLGGQVRKGEKGTLVVFWKAGTKKVQDDQTGEEVDKRWCMLRYFKVFNAAQADGLPAKFVTPTADDRTEIERLEAAETIVAHYLADGPSFAHGGDRAYYRPATDHVQMPERDAFTSAAGFYSTLFHELTHSTGHSTRLARPGAVTAHSFGDAVYSQEELVAEMGAAMLCAVAGIPQDATLPSSAAYIASWLQVLKGDPKMVVMAAAQAQKAADLIAAEVAQAEEVTEAA